MENPDPIYHLVIIPDAGPPSLESFTSPEEMARRMGDFLGSSTSCLAFAGRPWKIKLGPNPQLLTPGGEKSYPIAGPSEVGPPIEGIADMSLIRQEKLS